MPIINAAWGRNGSFDRHLVKGQSTSDLLSQLFFLRADREIVTAFDYFVDPNTPNDVTVRFTVQLTGHHGA